MIDEVDVELPGETPQIVVRGPDGETHTLRCPQCEAKVQLTIGWDEFETVAQGKVPAGWQKRRGFFLAMIRHDCGQQLSTERYTPNDAQMRVAYATHQHWLDRALAAETASLEALVRDINLLAMEAKVALRLIRKKQKELPMRLATVVERWLDESGFELTGTAVIQQIAVVDIAKHQARRDEALLVLRGRIARACDQKPETVSILAAQKHGPILGNPEPDVSPEVDKP